MEAIARFSLEKHNGAYETWPLRTRVIADGTPTNIRIPGYSLLHQYTTRFGHVLITDDDCPFEEATHIALLGDNLRLLSCRSLSAPYASFNLDHVEWIDESSFRAVFHEGDCWLVKIRPWGIPFFRPRLAIRRTRLDGQKSSSP